jgi:hypothetical protein
MVVDGLLGRAVAGRLGAKDGDGAGAKDTHQLSLPGDFQDVVQAVDVHVPGHQWLFLAHSRQDGGHVIDGIDPVSGDDLFQALPVGHVDIFKRATVAQNRTWFRPVPGGHDVLGTVPSPQFDRQLGADLPDRSRDKDPAHFSFCHRKTLPLVAGWIERV